MAATIEQEPRSAKVQGAECDKTSSCLRHARSATHHVLECQCALPSNRRRGMYVSRCPPVLRPGVGRLLNAFHSRPGNVQRPYRQLMPQRRHAATAASPAGAPTYAAALGAAFADPREFWGAAAAAIYWHTPPKTILDASSPPFYRWFVGGTTNTAYNALDAHVEAGRGNQAALVYHSAATGVAPTTYTYAQLLREVEAAAGVFRSHGVRVGDRVLISCSMVPEGAIAMLACARIGAVHTTVFGGFASAELAVRIRATTPKLVVVSSCGVEAGGKIVKYGPLLEAALALAADSHRVDRVVVVQRPQWRSALTAGRDVDWAVEIARVKAAGLGADPVWVPSGHPQYILGTSGSTGAPKQVRQKACGCGLLPCRTDCGGDCLLSLACVASSECADTSGQSPCLLCLCTPLLLQVVRDTGGHAVALKWAMQNVMGMAPGEVRRWFALCCLDLTGL